jgi:acyl CoA:acetate/3-ketoacid CoA transferase
MKTKVMQIEEALDFIRDGDSIVTSNGGGYRAIRIMWLNALEDRFIERNSPGGLTFVIRVWACQRPPVCASRVSQEDCRIPNRAPARHHALVER